MIVGLFFKFRGACIYTWVNVNLNFAEWNDLMFPQIHIFLFTEDEPIYILPFSIPISFNWVISLWSRSQIALQQFWIPQLYVGYNTIQLVRMISWLLSIN